MYAPRTTKQIDDALTIMRVGKAPKPRITSLSVWAGLGIIGTAGTASLAMSNPAAAGDVLGSLINIKTLAAGVALGGVAWLAHRWETMPERGWFGDAPDAIEQDTGRGMMDIELTETYRSIYKTDDVVVEVRDADQYSIHVVYHDDLNLSGKITALARRLGIRSKVGSKGADAVPVIVVDVFDKGCSAIMIPKPQEAWGEPVPMDTGALQQGKPIAHVGRAVTGESIIVDFRLEHGALVAGTSGSGKTEVFVAILKSLQAASLPMESHVIDLKGTPQLKRIGADNYISTDPEAAIECMEALSARLKERMDKYSRADCDNLWQYQKRVDAAEKAIVLMVDEWAVLSRLTGKDEETGDKQADRAKRIMSELAQLGRSGGLILVVGMQHPLADDLPTTIRNQLMIRIVLAVADRNAAEVTGIPGAQHQPMQGGMMVRHGGDLTVGRGVYLS